MFHKHTAQETGSQEGKYAICHFRADRVKVRENAPFFWIGAFLVYSYQPNTIYRDEVNHSTFNYNGAWFVCFSQTYYKLQFKYWRYKR